ncbi:Ig-like domain-containing protein [Limnoraphis robusta]|uniref:Ig-like domain-containing protein n=1 Tax=Limnoraphis robusta TaxID=1118279 RepID=UPI00066DFF71|nr:Ig-like domain-containing protein [Limnoraphis robusta]
MIEINGTAGNDNLPGTGEADVIFGLEGNDLISGSSGDDSLFGFEGNDTLYGNEGNDTLFGNQNSDLLIGWGGEDWLFGGKGGDIIEDGTGEDQVFGNLGDDLLKGGADNDQKYGGQANDTVIGGTGNDQVFGDRGNDILWGVDVDAINPGINEIDTLTGGSEQDIFVLGDQSRLYYIGSGNNDFALITDFNVVEDQINVGNNQVIYAETVLNELGLGVAISSQSGDLIAFVQNANVSQFITGSNVVEPPQTEEAIPRQIEEPQFPEVIVPTPTPDPIITPTPTPTPDPITPTPTPVVITPTPTPVVITPTPTPDPIITPTPTPVVITPTPTPTPVVITPTPTPTPEPVFTPTPTPTPDPIITPTPTPTPVVITPTPTPTPDPIITPTPTPEPVVTPTPTPTPVVITPTPTPTPDPIITPTPTPTPEPVVTPTPTPTPVVITPTPTPTPVVITPTPTPEPEPQPNIPPVADNDNYTTGFQSPITVDAVSGVLNGDTDSDGNTLTAILVNSPANGSVNLNENGSFSYTPNSGFSGVDSFIYVANDGKEDSDFATVTINIEPQEQTIHRNGYSQTNSSFILEKTFSLTNYGNNDQVIVDENSNTDLGDFREAVKDFVTVTYDEDLEQIIESTPEVVDLRVRFIERDDIIAKFKPIDEEGNPITDEQGNNIDEVPDSFQGDIIVYEFRENGTENILEELVFSTDFTNTDLPNKPINYNLATNSLEYIIEQDILQFTWKKPDAIQQIYKDYPFNDNEIILNEAEPPLPSEQTYSKREIDDTTVLTTFLLTNNGDNYQTIDDQDDSDTRSLFPEAIQDFVTYNNDSGIQLANLGDTINFNGETELIEEGTTLSFNNEGEPVFTGVDVETEITPVVDLRIKLIERDDIIAELEPTDEEGNPIVELDDSFEGSIILYEFFDTETETVLEELFLFTNEFSEQSEVDDAVNSLESIIEEDLLSFTLEKPDAIQVILGAVTPSEARSIGEGFVNPEE